jgi:hypothetical protein
VPPEALREDPGRFDRRRVVEVGNDRERAHRGTGFSLSLTRPQSDAQAGVVTRARAGACFKTGRTLPLLRIDTRVERSVAEAADEEPEAGRLGLLRVQGLTMAAVVEWRLRLYKIEPGCMDQWVEEWRAHIRPLREQHGFEVGGAWVAEQASTFVWLLGYAGPDGWDVADAAYYDSAERAAIEPDPARFIVEPQELAVRAVL